MATTWKCPNWLFSLYHSIILDFDHNSVYILFKDILCLEFLSFKEIPYFRRKPYIHCVCQKSQKCTPKAANFPACNYIIKKRRKAGAENIKFIRTNFNKLLQPKQETWVPNFNVKWHKTNTLWTSKNLGLQWKWWQLLKLNSTQSLIFCEGKISTLLGL